MKRCPKCDTVKELNEFFPDRTKADGKAAICRACHKIISNEYYYRNKEKALLATRKWQAENKEKVQAKKRIWRKNNPDKRREEMARWVAKDPERAKALFQSYAAKRRKTIKGNIVNRIAPAMARSLRGGKKGRAWEKLVGYTVDDLKVHIEKNFLPGMSWENRELWHIDHKIPISAFNFSTPQDIDFAKCWSLGNLQPMWACDNISKKDRIPSPHQPSLLLAIGG